MKKLTPFLYLTITLCFIFLGIGVMIGRINASAMPKMESSGYGETLPKMVDTRFDQPEFIDGKININVATMESLCRVPGIGEVLAKSIIAYRQMQGPFTSVDELLQVDGMGEGKLSKIREYVTIGK